jgi:Asp-tRNA(Asn)/Glu-tRNA(Gln) amidotransferase C subunit
MAKKEAALNTIGYICEEIAQLETTCLEPRSNEILTAVVAGMRADEPEPKIKVAATKALINALEFAKRNFEVTTSFFLTKYEYLILSRSTIIIFWWNAILMRG